MYVRNNKLAAEMTKALHKRIVKANPGVKLPETNAEFNALLDEVRPEGYRHLWPGCRHSLALHLKLECDSTFNNWFDAINGL